MNPIHQETYAFLDTLSYRGAFTENESRRIYQNMNILIENSHDLAVFYSIYESKSHLNEPNRFHLSTIEMRIHKLTHNFISYEEFIEVLGRKSAFQKLFYDYLDEKQWERFLKSIKSNGETNLWYFYECVRIDAQYRTRENLNTMQYTLIEWIPSYRLLKDEFESESLKIRDEIIQEIEGVDPQEVDAVMAQTERGDYEVKDSYGITKKRIGQQWFARKVKSDYGYRCAITGISTKAFLVASHIVPWSEDQSIRLDPTNGICLSLLVDRAFERGLLYIDDHYTIHINMDESDDPKLYSELALYDNKRLSLPKFHFPNQKHLERHRRSFGVQLNK